VPSGSTEVAAGAGPPGPGPHCGLCGFPNEAPPDLAVARAAGTLRYPAQPRACTQEPAPLASRLTELPEIDVPADEQQTDDRSGM
jgi:hypothetical protein